MKKNQLILAAALVVLAACTKANVESVNSAKMEADEIGFTAITQKATKANDAIITGATYATENSFKVWGWQSQKDGVSGDNIAFSDVADNSASNFMTNLTIEWTKGAVPATHDFAWRNADHYYYWPFTGSIGFLAIHPSDLSAGTYGTLTPAWDATNVKAKAAITDYTVSADNKTVDLMFASNKGTRETVAKVGTGEMNMVFKHALAQIEFYVRTNDDYTNDLQFDVESVQINNIDLSGDVDFVNDAISWADNAAQTQNWLYYNTVKENIQNWDFSVAAQKTAALYGAANVMIPQPANIKASELDPSDPAYDAGDDVETTITVSYSMQQLPKDANAKITGTVTVPAPWAKVKEGATEYDPAVAIPGWEAGKKYNYTLNFKLNEILFNPSVTEWVEVDVQTINILD